MALPAFCCARDVTVAFYCQIHDFTLKLLKQFLTAIIIGFKVSKKMKSPCFRVYARILIFDGVKLNGLGFIDPTWCVCRF